MNLGRNRQALRLASVEFFRDFLMLEDRAINYDDALAIIEVFLDCVSDKSTGCAKRRSSKQLLKKIVIPMKNNKPVKGEFRSTFTNFNKKILESLTGNSLLPHFLNYLLGQEEHIVSQFSPDISSCRKQSLHFIVKLGR